MLRLLGMQVHKASKDLKACKDAVVCQDLLDCAGAKVAEAEAARGCVFQAVRAAIVCARENEPAGEGALPTLHDLINDPLTFQAAGLPVKHVQLISGIDDRDGAPLEVISELRQLGEDIQAAKAQGRELRAALETAEADKGTADTAYARGKEGTDALRLLRAVQSADSAVLALLAQISQRASPFPW